MTLARPVMGGLPASEEAAAPRPLVPKGRSSFYWAMRLLGSEKRAAMSAIYGFCRAVDDVADSDAPHQVKVAELATWRRRIDALYAGTPMDPVTAALTAPVAAYGLARDDFHAVIAGMEMDVTGRMVAPSMDTLAIYCDRAAAAVGRLTVRVFGLDRAQGDALASSLGPALQLTNILRDVAEDAAAGRLYLPRELLDAHGIAARAPEEVVAHPAIGRVCVDLAALADGRFAAAWQELSACPFWPSRPARAMARVYERLHERLKARGFAPEDLARPVRLSGRETLMTALAACVR